MGNASRTVFSALAAIFVAIAWTTEPAAGDILRTADMLLPADLVVANCAQPGGNPMEIAQPNANPVDVGVPEATSMAPPCSEEVIQGIEAAIRAFCGPEGGWFRATCDANGKNPKPMAYGCGSPPDSLIVVGPS